MDDNNKVSQKLLERLDRIISLLESVIILQGANLGINKHEIRKLAGVGMNRVTDTAALLKEEKAS